MSDQDARNIQTPPQRNVPPAHSGTGLGHGQILCERYQLEHRIGCGAKGSIFRARDLRDGTACAVKLIDGPAGSTEERNEDCARFLNEATILEHVWHPHIVEFRDFRVDASGIPFLVLELLPGQDLHSYLQYHGRLAFAQAAAIAAPIASALHALHRSGVIHRDIKPRNIMISPPADAADTRQPAVKLVDFGLAKIVGHSFLQTAGDIVLGTPEYLPPEALQGRSIRSSTATDQWGLAMLIYRMLTGQGRGAHTAPDSQVLPAREGGWFRPALRGLAQGMPPHALAALERALNKDRRERFPSILEFWRAFSGLKTGLAPHREYSTLAEIPIMTPRERSGGTQACVDDARDRYADGNTRPVEQTRPMDRLQLQGLLLQSTPAEGTAGAAPSSASAPGGGKELGSGVSVAPAVADGQPSDRQASMPARRRRRFLGFLAALLASAVLAGLLARVGARTRGTQTTVATSQSLPEPASEASMVNFSEMVTAPSVVPDRRGKLGSLGEHPRRAGGRTSGPAKGAASQAHSAVSPRSAPATALEPVPAAAASAGGATPVAVPAVAVAVPSSLAPAAAVNRPPVPEPRPATSPGTPLRPRLRPLATPDPQLSSHVRQALGADVIRLSYTVCVGHRGQVERVLGSNPFPFVDDEIKGHIQRTWRYEPPIVPLCTPFELQHGSAR